MDDGEDGEESGDNKLGYLSWLGNPYSQQNPSTQVLEQAIIPVVITGPMYYNKNDDKKYIVSYRIVFWYYNKNNDNNNGNNN